MEHKCKFCGQEFDRPNRKRTHEVWCYKNPNSRRVKKSNPDPTPEKEDKIGLTEEQTKVLSSISSFASLLKSYGIESGEDLLAQVDEKARQMPFYKELSANIEQINKRLDANSKDIVELTGILDEINKKLTYFLQQLEKVHSQPYSQVEHQQVGQQIQGKEIPTQVAQVPSNNNNNLTGWFDRILRLMEVAGGGGGEGATVPVEMPPEIKYKDLIELSNVLKSLQGYPYKQLREDLKLFVSIANAFRTGKVPEFPEEKTAHLEE